MPPWKTSTQHPRGTVEIESDAHRIPPAVVVRVVGHATVDMIAVLHAHLERMHRDHPSFRLFYDLEQLSGYDTAAREAIAEHSARWEPMVGTNRTTLLVKSRVVAMGISIVGMVRGRSYLVFSDRASWEKERLRRER